MSLTILLKREPQMMVTILWVMGHHLIPVRLVKNIGAHDAMMPYKTTLISRSTEINNTNEFTTQVHGQKTFEPMDFNSRYYILNILINDDSEVMQCGTSAFPSIVEISLFDTRPNIKSDLSYV